MHKTALLSALLLAACVDEDSSTTTFSTFVTTLSPMSNFTTNITSHESQAGDEGESPTTGYTTGDADTDSVSATSALGTTSESTGDASEPLPDPPAGCALIVEAIGRGNTSERYIVIDMTGCARADAPIVRFETTPSIPDWELELPHRDCGVFGGPNSPAATTPDGVVMNLGTFQHDDAEAWRMTVLVGGLPADDLRVPGILQGQDWPEMPDAPLAPVRRREDFSLVPVAAHVGGCDLLTVP